jgi:hypothetical protein
MNKLKVGDRIKIYQGYDTVRLAIIKQIDRDLIIADEYIQGKKYRELEAHYKQCRKLVKKKDKNLCHCGRCKRYSL